MSRMLARLAGMAFIALFAMSFITACKPSDPICGSQFNRGESFENICSLRVEPNTESLRLTMQASLSQGELHWQLTDPQGEVTWEGSGISGRQVNTHWSTVKPAPGRWMLKIYSIDGIGEYQAPWTVK